MTRTIAITLTLLTLSACSAATEEDVAAEKMALTNCREPFPNWHTMTAIVATQSVPPDATCPLAWFPGWDPIRLRAGKITGGAAPAAPTVDAGPCQWRATPAAPPPGGEQSCKFALDFSCPNGIRYTGFMTATARDWSKASLALVATEVGCTRAVLATFNVSQ